MLHQVGNQCIRVVNSWCTVRKTLSHYVTSISFRIFCCPSLNQYFLRRLSFIVSQFHSKPFICLSRLSLTFSYVNLCIRVSKVSWTNGPKRYVLYDASVRRAWGWTLLLVITLTIDPLSFPYILITSMFIFVCLFPQCLQLSMLIFIGSVCSRPLLFSLSKSSVFFLVCCFIFLLFLMNYFNLYFL